MAFNRRGFMAGCLAVLASPLALFRAKGAEIVTLYGVPVEFLPPWDSPEWKNRIVLWPFQWVPLAEMCNNPDFDAVCRAVSSHFQLDVPWVVKDTETHEESHHL